MFRTLTNTVAFGGNGQFCKLSTLQALNEEPWTDSLVEDFDLSTRLFLSDIEMKNAQYDDIYIEQTGIINDNEALVKQRVRWAQGNIQSSKYIVPTIRSKHLLAAPAGSPSYRGRLSLLPSSGQNLNNRRLI